jgi:hypothetical protein
VSVPKHVFVFLSFISVFAIFVILGPLTVFYKNLTYCEQRTCMIVVINAVTIEQLHVVTSYRGYVWACANLAIPWCWFQVFIQLVTKWENRWVWSKQTIFKCCRVAVYKSKKSQSFSKWSSSFLASFLIRLQAVL